MDTYVANFHLWHTSYTHEFVVYIQPLLPFVGAPFIPPFHHYPNPTAPAPALHRQEGSNSGKTLSESGNVQVAVQEVQARPAFPVSEQAAPCPKPQVKVVIPPRSQKKASKPATKCKCSNPLVSFSLTFCFIALQPVNAPLPPPPVTICISPAGARAAAAESQALPTAPAVSGEHLPDLSTSIGIVLDDVALQRLAGIK